MASLRERWWALKHRRRFAKIGRDNRFLGGDLQVDGHVEIGHACRFRNHIVLRTSGNGRIVFGDRSGASWFTIIEARELVQIGDGTKITDAVIIRDTTHVIYGTEAHWYLTPLITKPVILGKDIFVGARSYLHPGVTVGDGAVIGVSSVVKEDTQIGPYEIWAGVPARRVGHRTEDVPPAKLAEAQALIAKYGIQQDRYEEKLARWKGQ